MAVQDPTVNYSWPLPDVGGDVGAWGGMLRTIIGDDATGIDKRVKDVSDVANAALPKAGGTMTGRVDLKNEAFTAVNLGGSLSGTVNVDLSLGNFFYGTLSGGITITFSNIPTGAVFVVLEFTNPSTHSVTFPAALSFAEGSPKTLISNRVQTYALYTRNTGTDWRGAHMANMTP